MRELDDIDQRLDLARLALSSTPDARVRVRARLAARGAFSPAGRFANARHGVSKLVTATLVGVSFAGGYWLRDIQETETLPERPRVVQAPPADAPPRAAVETSPRASDSRAAPSARPARAEPDTRVDRHVTPPVASPTHQREPGVSPSDRRRAARPPSPAPTSRAAVTSGELTLLRRTERALRAGDPTLALILLDQLDRDYPRSALGEERAAARILVECARSGELAQPEAVRFLEGRPGTVYSDRIIRACMLEGARR